MNLRTRTYKFDQGRIQHPTYGTPRISVVELDVPALAVDSTHGCTRLGTSRP